MIQNRIFNWIKPLWFLECDGDFFRFFRDDQQIEQINQVVEAFLAEIEREIQQLSTKAA